MELTKEISAQLLSWTSETLQAAEQPPHQCTGIAGWDVAVSSRVYNNRLAEGGEQPNQQTTKRIQTIVVVM
jgi:hypothetical protein